MLEGNAFDDGAADGGLVSVEVAGVWGSHIRRRARLEMPKECPSGPLRPLALLVVNGLAAFTQFEWLATKRGFKHNR